MENNMNTNTNPETGEKTFSQEEVNRIVGERLSKEKAKSEAELGKREQELVQREIRIAAKEMLAEKGMSAQLLDVLNCADKDSMEKGIGILEEVFNQTKNERSQATLKGVKPGASGNEPEDQPCDIDTEVRRAMGLQ